MRYLIFYQKALLRHFSTTLLELANRGHELVFATSHGRKIPGELLTHDLVQVVSWKKTGPKDPARERIRAVRRARDFARYLDPALRPAWANRERAWKKFAGLGGRSLLDLPPAPWIDLQPQELELLNATFAQIEEYIPPDPWLCEALAEYSPDAVLVTPLVSISAPQTDIVKAARAIGVPCGALVFSWDNLSNKGLIHVAPDAVFVWNDLQLREAVDLHRVPLERVVVTGSPRFDEFYSMKPSKGRKKFFTRHGLDPKRKMILFLGSSPFVSEEEPRFVDSWLEALRSSDRPEIREACVFIRPHPRSRGIWADWHSDRWAQVAVETRPSIYRLQALYDQIAYCDAVVGLNTSAELEAAILGKPVYTVDAAEFAPGQEGSSHFYYLLGENGGFVEHAHSMDEHLAQLGAGLRGEYDERAIKNFAASFLRPRGVELPATPILVDEIESLARRDERGGTPSVLSREENGTAVPDEAGTRRSSQVAHT